MVYQPEAEKAIPLEQTWNYFLDNGSWAPNPEDYLTVMTKLGSVSTVQDFWRYMNSMEGSMQKILSQQAPVFSLRAFRSDVKPIWEDKHNTHGGKWVVPCSTMDSAAFWALWVEVLMCVVGESFNRKGAVCGVVMSSRKNGKKEIQIWTDSIPADMDHEKNFLTKLLKTSDVYYRSHDSSLARVDTRQNNSPTPSTIAEEPSMWNQQWTQQQSRPKTTFLTAPLKRVISLSPQTSCQTSPAVSPPSSPESSCRSSRSSSSSFSSASSSVSLSPQTTPSFSIRMLTKLAPAAHY